MNFEILDPNVSLTMNIFIVIANVLNILYNVPQMYLTYRRKTTKDISGWFLTLRIVANIIWVAYAVELGSFLMLLNNSVTVGASIFVCYFKIIELHKVRKLHEDSFSLTEKLPT